MARHRTLAAVVLVATLAAGCDGLLGSGHSSRARDRGAGSGDWTLIAQRSIDFSSDRESIDVGSDRRFHALRFAVKGAPVEVGNMVVTFRDGSTFSPQMRSTFEEGSESRAIDLPGEARRIERIDLASRSTSKREGRATILIYGR
jgi:hypothetical protein